MYHSARHYIKICFSHTQLKSPSWLCSCLQSHRSKLYVAMEHIVGSNRTSIVFLGLLCSFSLLSLPTHPHLIDILQWKPYLILDILDFVMSQLQWPATFCSLESCLYVCVCQQIKNLTQVIAWHFLADSSKLRLFETSSPLIFCFNFPPREKKCCRSSSKLSFEDSFIKKIELLFPDW